MTARLELYVSQRRTIDLILLTCAMVGVSYFCTTLPGLKPRVVGWLGVCFFGLGFVVLPRQLMRTTVQFSIDERGLEDRRSQLGVIEWCDITAMYIGTIKSQQLLCIEVADVKKYTSRLSKVAQVVALANRSMGIPEITLAFSGLSRSTDEVWRFIQEHYPRVVRAVGTASGPIRNHEE
jgi:hypothetical protein